MPQINELMHAIEAGKHDADFEKLYAGNKAVWAIQRIRYTEALKKFAELYGENRDVCVYSAPGRTEIGGNHTDHNNGVVMAAAVNLDIIAVVARNRDNMIRVKSAGFDKQDIIHLTDLQPNEKEFGCSMALVRGVAAGIVKRGGCVGGFDAYTTSAVLRGSGLSSSAAFEVVIGAILNGEYNETRFTPIEIAMIGQYAENIFFGKPSGLMDQTASSMGSTMTIDFKDPSAPVVKQVELDLERHGFALCITDTKGSHADLTDEYAAIRSEMEHVAAFFGQKVLREVSKKTFFAQIPALREKLGDRAVLRAIHFFADCARAAALCKAVAEDRFEDFLQLIIEGGHSSFEYNQNAYSVKNPMQQGVALGLALSQNILQGKGAWRLQGGGFAGTIQAFVPFALLAEYKETMEHVFGAGACYTLSLRKYGAVRAL